MHVDVATLKHQIIQQSDKNLQNTMLCLSNDFYQFFVNQIFMKRLNLHSTKGITHGPNGAFRELFTSKYSAILWFYLIKTSL